MTQHIAVFSDELAEKVMSGKKTADLRLAELKCAPFQKIAPGDRIYIKPSGKRVIGECIAGTVISYEDLDPERIQEIRTMYNATLAVPNSFFERHKNARYGTLIFIRSPRRYLVSVYMTKRNRGGWKVLKQESTE